MNRFKADAFPMPAAPAVRRRTLLLAGCVLAAGSNHSILEAQTTVTISSPSFEVCPVTVPRPEPTSPTPSYLATGFDFAGSDQGLSVDDPVNQMMWLFAGDAKSADSNAWFGVTGSTTGGANMIGYLNGSDYGNPPSLCNHLKLVTVPGMTSRSGGAVWSPDVMVPPPGDSIGNYIFNPTPKPSGATAPVLPTGSGIPGINEATTGAFLDAGTIYLFYAGSPGVQVLPGNALGFPVTSVSYLAAWTNPSTTGKTSNLSPTTYQILARVDYSLDNADTTTCPGSFPTLCPPAPPPGWKATAPTPPLGGHFVWVDPVEGGDGFVYLFGTGKYRASNVYLARLPLSALASIGRCASPPCYLGQTSGFQIWTAVSPGGSSQAPGWSSSPPSAAEIGAATPLSFPDDPNPDLGQVSVRFFDSVGGGGLWLMMATPVGNPAFDQKVIARWSASPTGPWSQALSVFDVSNNGGSQKQKLYCCQGPWNMKLDTSGLKVWECLAPQDGAAAQQIMECRDASSSQTSGSAGPPRYGFYSPFMLPYLTNVSSSSQTRSGTRYVTDTFTVSYLLSIFEPYNSVLMSYTLQAVSPNDFALTASAGSVTLVPGGSATASVSTTNAGGFDWSVDLSVTGLPSGVTASFAPSSIAAPGSGSSTLSFRASTSAVPGSYPITIAASGGGASHTATIQLNVTPPQTALLSRSRVQVTVQWQNPYSGQSGTAYALPQTDQFAFFYYSDPTDPEVFVKVLDFGSGSALCFVGGLTDFYYKVTFTVVLTGQQLVFEKPAYQYIGFVDATTLKFANTPGTPQAAATVSPQAVAPQSLAFSSGRVSVTVDWKNPYSGETGRAYGIPKADQYGFFYYSDPTNPEVFVKVLDFGSGSALCFVGGLTDFYYKVTFTVVLTGQQLVFEKPAYQYIGFVDATTLKFVGPALYTLSFSVGPDITLSYPNLPVLSDEHTTVMPSPTTPGSYLVFAANMRNAGNLSGPVVLETTDLRTFSFASGYTSPVMTAPIPFTTCKAAYDPEFDLNYASPGSVLQDPTRPPGNLIMIYEAENHCPGAVWQHDFYATVGLARSSDFGKTWPRPIDAELGGTDRYPVLKAPTPEPGFPESPQVAMGNAIPSAFVDGNTLYVAYVAPGPTSDGMLRVARATLGGSGPLSFSKWNNGAFGQPGIGGQDSGVLPARGCTGGHQGMGQISYNDSLGLYLMTFVCSSSTQGAWYFSTATSLDIQNWTAPQMIENSQLPVTQGCATDGTGTGFDGWYPSFVSPDSPAGHTGMTGSVFYMNGCDRGSRTFLARTFTITKSP